MSGHVNVGTIGHIDHGKTTLTAALIKVLGEEMARDVIIVDGSTIVQENELLARAREIEIGGPFECESAIMMGRPRNPARKAERKARMRDLQRRAFAGDRP